MVMRKGAGEKSLGYAVGRANWYMKTLINKLMREEECGITNEQWLVLKVIADTPGMSQTEIAAHSQKDKTNITRLIDVLEKAGFIERRKDDQDRRMYRIHATEAGREVLRKVGPITERIDDIAVRPLDAKQVRDLMETLDAVCASIKKEL